MVHLVQPEAILETSRLLIEPIRPEHALVLYESLQSPAIYEFIPEDPPASPEALATRYQKLSARMSPDGQETWLNWGMRIRDEDTYVGILQATVYPDETAYLAYILFPQFWRRGYAKEGCRRILELLFTDYQVRIVIAEIDTRNTASMKLVESLGFQQVDTKLDADYFKGSTSHEYRYELLSPDQAG